MGTGYVSRLTGEWSDFPTPEEARARRLARMRQMIWLAIRGLSDIVSVDGGTLVMYTLTYARVGEWEPRHISEFCRWLRRGGQPYYAWVAELQDRGAVHYHVLAHLPAGQPWVKPTAAHGGWARGFTWVTANIKRPYYIMKYLQKGDKHGRFVSYPRGLRLYGVARSVTRRYVFEDAITYRYAQLPGWAKEAEKDACTVLSSRRAPGGITYGRWIECSPYSRHDLDDLDTVGRLMYTQAWGSGLLSQG